MTIVATERNQKKLLVLDMACSILQIAGLAVLIFQKLLPDSSFVVIGIAGFAAIVSYLAPTSKNKLSETLSPVAAICGLGLIIYACSAI